MSEKNPFKNVDDFINGQQTSRPLRDGELKPPAIPGDQLLNRQGDLALGAVTNNTPTYQVDNDEYPTVQPLSLDGIGRLRVVMPAPFTLTTVVTGAISVSPGTGTSTVVVANTVTVTGSVISTPTGTTTTTIVGQVAVTSTPTGTTTVVVTGTVVLAETPTVAISGTVTTTIAGQVSVTSTPTGTTTVVVTGAVAVHDTTTATVTVVGTVNVVNTQTQTATIVGQVAVTATPTGTTTVTVVGQVGVTATPTGTTTVTVVGAVAVHDTTTATVTVVGTVNVVNTQTQTVTVVGQVAVTATPTGTTTVTLVGTANVVNTQTQTVTVVGTVNVVNTQTQTVTVVGTVTATATVQGLVATTSGVAQFAGGTIQTIREDPGGSLRVNPYGQTGSFQSSTGTATTAVTLTVAAATKWFNKGVVFSVNPSGTSTRQFRVLILDAAGNVLREYATPVITPTNTIVMRLTLGDGSPVTGPTSIAGQNLSSLTGPLQEAMLGPSFQIVGQDLSAANLTRTMTLTANVNVLPD